MNSNEKNNLALETLKFPVSYDNRQQTIYDAKGMMVCDIRGWGKIQFMNKSEDRQDAIGELIANLLNKNYRNENARIDEALFRMLAS
jgi:ArsR family metal-binding transcriptional regulator